MARSGASASLLTESSMQLGVKTEQSKCGRTARVHSDCGARIGNNSMENTIQLELWSRGVDENLRYQGHADLTQDFRYKCGESIRELDSFHKNARPSSASAIAVQSFRGCFSQRIIGSS
jgi:hypothetical protein